MSQCQWSERVAMLMDAEDAAARHHLASCAACRELWADLESDRGLLRSMPVPEMRLRARRRPLFWPWAAAIAAALLIGAFLWPPPLERLALSVPAPGGADFSLPGTPVPPASNRAKTHRSPKPAAPSLAAALEAALPPLATPPAAASGDVVIAMKTEDPDVIIVLVQGDSYE